MRAVMGSKPSGVRTRSPTRSSSMRTCRPLAVSRVASAGWQWLDPALEIDGNSNEAVVAGVMVADPMLSRPADNGGSTWTMALGEGSPAVDAGVEDALDVDQRGEPRGLAPDVGAYELQ